MKVAALYDIHGMLDALEAVLAEVDREDVDALVLGGDVVGGPQPAEVLARLRELDRELIWVRGNGDRALGPDGARAVAEGDEHAEALRFTAERLEADDRAFLAQLPPTARLDVDGLGPTLFCHATPQNDLDLITSATPDGYLLRAAEGVGARTIVSGHTHMQFDRRVGDLRWINVGSVGMPYEGRVAAFWALLGPDVELRHTSFDVERAAEAILASGWPPAGEFVAENVRRAEPRETATEFFERLAAERGQRD
ncbi:MAG TPA: metallophosphoesterase family protein [Gaiellaceae bacterium]